jgi:membrane protein CcdC involved in cytochrome C biogenesis
MHATGGLLNTMSRYRSCIPAMSHLNILSFLGSIAGAVAVMLWRIRETRVPVSTNTIVLPPLGMATGFSMFIMPAFRVPWSWGIASFLIGVAALAYPLIRTSRLVCEGNVVTVQRSNTFLAIVIVLAGVRIAAHGYLDTVLTVQQTAALFFVLAFGMILRWRTQMFLEYRALIRKGPGASAERRERAW